MIYLLFQQNAIPEDGDLFAAVLGKLAEKGNEGHSTSVRYQKRQTNHLHCNNMLILSQMQNNDKEEDFVYTCVVFTNHKPIWLQCGKIFSFSIYIFESLFLFSVLVHCHFLRVKYFVHIVFCTIVHTGNRVWILSVTVAPLHTFVLFF